MDLIIWSGLSLLVAALCCPFLFTMIKNDFKRLEQQRKESNIEEGLDGLYLRFTMVDYLIIKTKALMGDKSE